MTARTRSLAGALMMLAIIPIIVSLLACMPEYVPLGDPERARLEPEMTGIWFGPGEDEIIGNVLALSPWHQRPGGDGKRSSAGT